MNGKKINLSILSLMLIACVCMVMYIHPAYADGRTIIDTDITIDGISKPTLGSLCPGSSTTSNFDIKLKDADSLASKCYIRDVEWHWEKDDKSLSQGHRFSYNRQYSLVIYLSANDGYYFDVDKKIKFTIDGTVSDAEFEVIGADWLYATELKCSYTFKTKGNNYDEYAFVGGAMVTQENKDDILGPYDGTKASARYVSKDWNDGTCDTIYLDNVQLSGKIVTDGSVTNWTRYDYENGGGEGYGRGKENVPELRLYLKGTNIFSGIKKDLGIGSVDLYIDGEPGSQLLIIDEDNQYYANYVISGFRNVTFCEGTQTILFENKTDKSEQPIFLSAKGNVTLEDNTLVGVMGNGIATLAKFIDCGGKFIVGAGVGFSSYGTEGAIIASDIEINGDLYDITCYDAAGNSKSKMDEAGVVSVAFQGVVRDGWQRLNAKWYYFKNSSKPVTGWERINYKWYYFNQKGAMVTGWQMIDGKWYYFNTNGDMATGWVQVGGKWYYLQASGEMATGWVMVDGSWYYMNKDGDMKTGWLQYANKWYYLSPKTGAMVTGWMQERNIWYYLNADGVMVTGWLQIGANWYYLNSDGAMVAGKTIKIGRVNYTFNSNGVWIK